MNDSVKAHLALLVCMISWSSAFVMIRASVGVFSSGELGFLRYLVASIVVLAFYFRPGATYSVKAKDILPIAAIGFLGIAAYNILINQAGITLTSATCSFIITQVPIVTAIIAYLFLKESLSLKSLLGFFVSFAGVSVIALANHQGGSLEGMIEMFIAVVLGSLYSILQKPILKRVHPLDFISVVIWSATFFMLPYAPGGFAKLATAPSYAIELVILLGVFPAAIGYALWSYGIHKLTVSSAVSYLYVMPLFTLVIGFLTLGESPGMITIIGGFIALTGTYLINRAQNG